MIDKIYYINLDEEKYRRYKIEKNLRNQLIPFERFPGINGKKLKLNIIKYLFNNKILKYNIQVEKKGRLGTYLSHYYLLKKIYQNKNINNILILEDDSIIPISFNKNIKYISNFFPIKYDIIFLGHLSKINGIKINNYLTKASNINAPNTNNGLFAYIINRKSIPKILNLISPINNGLIINNKYNINHIDWELRKYYGIVIDAYYTNKNLIFHNENLISNRKIIDKLS